MGGRVGDLAGLRESAVPRPRRQARRRGRVQVKLTETGWPDHSADILPAEITSPPGELPLQLRSAFQMPRFAAARRRLPPHLSGQSFQPGGGAPLASGQGILDPAAVDMNVLHGGGHPGMASVPTK